MSSRIEAAPCNDPRSLSFPSNRGTRPGRTLGKMIEVYTDPDFTRVGYYKSVLESNDIGCFIKNEATFGLGAGFFATVQTPLLQPSLCIFNAADYEDALSLLARHHATESEPQAEWSCPQCGESVPVTFDACWNCEAPKTLPAP